MNSTTTLKAAACALLIYGASPIVSSAQDASLILRQLETKMDLQDENDLGNIEEMSITHDHKVKPSGLVTVEWTNILGETSTQELKPKDPSFKSMYAFSASVDQGIAAVGAPKEGLMKTGAIYIFTYADGTWEQDDKVVADNGEANDGFGYQLEVYEGKVIVASPGRDTDAANEGVVFIYEKKGAEWQVTTEIEAKGFYPDMHFGRELSIVNGMLSISVTNKKESLAGLQYEFDLEGNKSGVVELDPIGSMPDTEPDISGATDVVGIDR
ncbi:MAG: hypothetical protein AAGA85_16515 [Bacteroidota bacterium]